MDQIIRLNPECISCVLKKRLDSFPDQMDRLDRILYLQEMLKIIGNAPKSYSAPQVVREIERLEKRMFGSVKEYGERACAEGIINQYTGAQLMATMMDYLWFSKKYGA